MACKVADNTVYVRTPTPEHRFAARQVYLDTLYESELLGVLTDDEMQRFMISNGFWSIDEESELTTASTRVDTLKEEMYGKYAAYQSRQVERCRHLLTRLRIRSGELFKKRHAYDIYTCTGLASISQLQYLLSKNTIDENGNLITDMDDSYIKQLSEQYVTNKPTDNDVRQLCKEDIWRSIWHSAKGSTSVFGVSAVQLSDEQRSLIGWSRLYDNIAEAAETPEKDVIEDDDLLDGWLIVQHKRRENERQDKSGEYGNRHNKAQEVFIPAETMDDARRIDSMNDLGAQITKKQRSNLVRQYGSIQEQDMPDSKQKIMMEANKQFAEGVKSM